MAENTKELSVKVYYLDASGNYLHHFRLEDEGYQAKDGETTVPKPASLQEPTRFIGGAWQGATDEEHDAYVKAENAKHPENNQPQGPSAEQQMINTLGKNQMEQENNIKKLQQMVNFLGKQAMATK